MKYLVLALLSFQLFSQTTNTQFESTFDNAQQLTDKEAYDAVRYENQARNQNIYNEKCKEFNEKMRTGANGVKIHGELNDCTENSVNQVGQSFGGSAGATLETMVPVVSKMYSMVLGMPGMSKITSSLKHTKMISRGEKAGKDLSEFQAKDSHGDVLKSGDKNFYKTGHEGYVADGDGNIYKSANGQVADVPCGNECSDVQKDYKKQKEKKEKEDYCSKLPMATELIAGATQIFKEANIEKTKLEGADIQRNSLYALKNTHEQRSKTAQIQAGGWFATSGCYLGYITAGFVSGNPVDWKTYLKLGASGFLGTFYQLKVKKHKEYAGQIDSLIAELPKRGECNPHTDTHCFCGEPTSKQIDPANYQRYCLPAVYAHTGILDPMSCVNKDMEIDNTCDCQKSGSCISHELTKTNPIGIDLGNSFMSDALKDISALNRGNYASANLASMNNKNLAASIRKALNDNEKSIPSSADTDKNLVRSIMSAGIPASLARQMASHNSNPLSLEFSKAQASTLNKAPVAGETSFVGGEQLAANQKFENPTEKKDSEEFNPMSLFNKKSGDGAGGSTKVEILDFQEKAAREAEISKNSNQSIFEIISNRYSTSAWRKFEVKYEEPEKK